MNKILPELNSLLAARSKEMVSQLHLLCEINSGSHHLEGLQKMCVALKNMFRSLADNIETHALPPVTDISMQGETILQSVGELLYIRKRPTLKDRILLCGHMDTVYSKNHPFQTLKYIDDNCINGPGVADMKGGLIVLFEALQAFEQQKNANTIGWDVVINPDEELGSPASAAFLESIAKNYKAAFVYEPAMTSAGDIAKNRKGSGKFTIIATGKASHAGRAFEEGRNAIAYLAEVVLAIYSLNSKRKGVTINIGKISGGEALNIVPEKAVLKLDIRITEQVDAIWVENELKNIIQQCQRPGYSLNLIGSFSRPVKKVNQETIKLFERLKRIGNILNLNIDWKDSGGCCDGNNLSYYGLAVLDTLGVRGGNIHSSEEYILVDSLVERAKLSALLLMDIANVTI